MKSQGTYKGKVHIFGDNVPGDGGILPLMRDFGNIIPEELAKMCMVPIDPNFPQNANTGDFIVAGKNFPFGWFHEQDIIAMKALGLSGVIADSISELFLRLLFDYGLLGLPIEGVSKKLNNGELVEYNLNTGQLYNVTKNKELASFKLPQVLKDILQKGGTIPYIKEKLM